MFDYLRLQEMEFQRAAQRERVHIAGPVPEPSRPPGGSPIRPMAELVIPDGWVGLVFQAGRLQLRLPAGPQRFSALGVCEVRLMPADTPEDGAATAGRTLWFADGQLLCTERRWMKEDRPVPAGAPRRVHPLGARPGPEEEPDISFSFV